MICAQVAAMQRVESPPRPPGELPDWQIAQVIVSCSVSSKLNIQCFWLAKSLICITKKNTIFFYIYLQCSADVSASFIKQNVLIVVLCNRHSNTRSRNVLGRVEARRHPVGRSKSNLYYVTIIAIKVSLISLIRNSTYQHCLFACQKYVKCIKQSNYLYCHLICLKLFSFCSSY